MKAKNDWIIDDSNLLIRQKSEDITIPVSKEDQVYIDKMVEYIDEAFDGSNDEINPGIAIAAPQVGLLKKVIYVHFLDNNEIEHKYLLANPKIVAESKAISYIPHGEGCLSVPSHHNGIVKRRNKVQIKAFDLVEKKNITINASGMLSICLQHEIDHLYGILYYDRINKEDKNFIGEDWISV